MTKSPLILASTSRYKIEQLRTLRLPFQALDPHVMENHDELLTTDPEAMAIMFATQKAKAIASYNSHAWVIGSDQTAMLETNERLTKPGSFESAVNQLKSCSGKRVTFNSAICIVAPKKTQSWSIRTVVDFRDLSNEEIERYVQLDQPLDCAGSFKIESLGISLFDSVASADPTALIGLPLISLSKALRGFGFNTP